MPDVSKVQNMWRKEEYPDKKEWSSIDIFLFSNGQQYSPPRKYHLRSEELQWWGTTMNYLGRTHYGAGHSSIELYGIDGTKINGPLELINGAAYVAVEPPDSFIDTGYEEYLLKASRSWEKSLAQKSYNTETASPGLKCDKEPRIHSDIVDINLPEKISNTASLKDHNDSMSLLKKPRPVKPYQRLQKKPVANSKQILKKKSFDMHNVMFKKICSETDKAFPNPKKTSAKENECTNQKPNIANSKLNKTINQRQSSYYKKIGSIKPKSNMKSEMSKDLNIHDSGRDRKPQIIELFSNDEIDVISLKNNQDPTLGDSIYHHEQRNLTGDNVPMLDGQSSVITNRQDIERHSSIKFKPINEYEQCDINLNDYQKNETESGREENIPLINNYDDNKTYNEDTVSNGKSEKQIVDEYVAHMKEGGLLLLKLKIKLKNCKTIVNRDKSKNIPITTSLSNLPQTEKTSQVDINITFSGELLQSNDQQYAKDKTLQSLLSKLYTEDSEHINSKDPRIIVLQCACPDFSENRTCCMCDTFHGCDVGDNKYEITLNQHLHETVTSCECQNESFKATEYPINNEDRPTLNATRVKDLAQKFENSDRTMQIEKNKCSNNEQSSNNIVMNDDRQSAVSTNFNSSSILGHGNGYKIAEGVDQISKRTCDKSTQTDWCNVLLEARRHEGDSYTFHLPSLYILKQCNI